MTDRDKAVIAKLELNKIKKRISNLYQVDKLDRLFWSATGAGAIDYSKDRVQTSPANTMEASIIEMIDLERVIELNRSELSEIVSDILDLPHGKIIYYRYIARDKTGSCLTWSDISRRTGLNKNQVMYLHRLGLVEYYNCFIQHIAFST